MSWLTQILAFFETARYTFIFLGSFIEGTGVMMTTGLLWKVGIVQFWPAYAALMLGDVLSDWMWYGIGYFGARKFIARWGRFINITPALVEKVEGRFNRYHLQILIISKLTMGFGLCVPILVTAGLMRVSFARYVAINLICGVFWVFFVMMIGYYFGNINNYIPGKFQILFLVGMPIAFFTFLFFATKKLEKLDW